MSEALPETHSLPAGRARAIVSRLALDHGVDCTEIFAPTRGSKAVARARFAAMAAVKAAFPHWSTGQLGRFFRRDHSTVVVGLQRARELGLSHEGP